MLNLRIKLNSTFLALRYATLHRQQTLGRTSLPQIPSESPMGRTRARVKQMRMWRVRWRRRRRLTTTPQSAWERCSTSALRTRPPSAALPRWPAPPPTWSSSRISASAPWNMVLGYTYYWNIRPLSYCFTLTNRYFQSDFGVNFLRWIAFGLPTSFLMLIFTWLWLLFFFLGFRAIRYEIKWKQRID